MSVLVSCACGKQHALPDSFRGKRVRCKQCRALISVPKISHSAGASDEDDGSPYAIVAGDPATVQCPECGMYLAAGAVVCIGCSYDLRAGKHFVPYETDLAQVMSASGVAPSSRVLTSDGAILCPFCLTEYASSQQMTVGRHTCDACGGTFVDKGHGTISLLCNYCGQRAARRIRRVYIIHDVVARGKTEWTPQDEWGEETLGFVNVVICKHCMGRPQRLRKLLIVSILVLTIVTLSLPLIAFIVGGDRDAVLGYGCFLVTVVIAILGVSFLAFRIKRKFLGAEVPDDAADSVFMAGAEALVYRNGELCSQFASRKSLFAKRRRDLISDEIRLSFEPAESGNDGS